MGHSEPHVSVSTAIGEMSVVDFGGSGIDTLMFHSPGFCAESLSLVAAATSSTCRSYSVELPGHGQSPTDTADAARIWPVIPEIVEGLQLRRPLLVGFDLSGFLVTAAAVQRPDLASAVVSIGGWCLRTRQETQDFLEFLTGDDVMQNLESRMLLGATSVDQGGMKPILAALARNAIKDFLIADEESRFADRIACTVRRTENGYVRLPTVDTVRRIYGLDPHDDVFPENGLLERVSVPYVNVLTSEGVDSDLIDRGAELADRKSEMGLIVIEAGNNPQMSHPAAVGEAIAAAAQLASSQPA